MQKGQQMTPWTTAETDRLIELMLEKAEKGYTQKRIAQILFDESFSSAPRTEKSIEQKTRKLREEGRLPWAGKSKKGRVEEVAITQDSVKVPRQRRVFLEIIVDDCVEVPLQEALVDGAAAAADRIRPFEDVIKQRFEMFKSCNIQRVESV